MLEQVRVRAGFYESTHLESGRTFEVVNKPGTYEWYAREHLADGKFGKKIEFKEVYAKKVFLAKLDDFITNPPAPPAPPAPYVPRPLPPKLPPQLPLTPCLTLQVEMSKIGEVFKLKTVIGGFTLEARVNNDRGVASDWGWYIRDDQRGDDLVRNAVSKEEAIVELQRVIDPVEFIPREGESGLIEVTTKGGKSAAKITFTDAQGKKTVTEVVFSSLDRKSIDRCNYKLIVKE